MHPSYHVQYSTVLVIIHSSHPSPATASIFSSHKTASSITDYRHQTIFVSAVPRTWLASSCGYEMTNRAEWLALFCLSMGCFLCWCDAAESTLFGSRGVMMFSPVQQQQRLAFLLCNRDVTASKTLRAQESLTILRGGDTTDDDENKPCCELPDTWAAKKRGLIFMDSFAPYHGRYLSKMARDAYGVAIVHVLSNYMTGFFLKHGDTEEVAKKMPSPEQVHEWKAQLPFDEIVGIICESDSGLGDAERLGVMLNLEKQNGILEARRDKFLMNVLVGKSGLAVVQQRLCRTLQEALDFVKELEMAHASRDASISDQNRREEKATKVGVLGRDSSSLTAKTLCVVKPVRGVASDDVFLCQDLMDVERAFVKIHGSTIFGSPAQEQHEAVLVQEFAAGTEYAIDTVSKGGEHKIAALWQYDKRPANGASFVYHATELVDADSHVGRIIFDYTKRTLDALGIRWGVTHTEVIVDTQGRPRLVEVNCRQHNTDFAPLTSFCIGYNSLDMVLAAYLGREDEYSSGMKKLDWDKVPHVASPTRAFGAIVHLVNHANGTLQGLNVGALEEIESMDSVVAMELYPHFCEMGNIVEPTVDIRTDAGWVHLINDDKKMFQQDYDRIVELMPVLFHASNTMADCR